MRCGNSLINPSTLKCSLSMPTGFEVITISNIMICGCQTWKTTKSRINQQASRFNTNGTIVYADLESMTMVTEMGIYKFYYFV